MSGSARNVLLTGASTGIGRASALALDRAGFRVFAGVRRSSDGAALAVLASERLVAVPLDVTDAAAIEAAAATVGDATGSDGLCGLVNNAGIAVAGPLEFLSSDDLRRQLEVNVVGQLAVTRAFLPLVRRAAGRIVFTGSSSGYFSAPFVGPYSASKFAIEALADALRRELRPWRIEVILIQPGAIATPIWEKSKKAADEIIAGLPAEGIERYGDAIETVHGVVDQRSASAAPVETVAAAIHRALVAKRPRTRYKVGVDAVLQAVLARLPDRWVDAALARAMSR